MGATIITLGGGGGNHHLIPGTVGATYMLCLLSAQFQLIVQHTVRALYGYNMDKITSNRLVRAQFKIFRYEKGRLGQNKIFGFFLFFILDYRIL